MREESALHIQLEHCPSKMEDGCRYFGQKQDLTEICIDVIMQSTDLKIKGDEMVDECCEEEDLLGIKQNEEEIIQQIPDREAKVEIHLEWIEKQRVIMELLIILYGHMSHSKDDND